MANLNKVTLIGNLTADPELRATPKGTAVTELRLAINRSHLNDNGQRINDVTYIDVTLWGKQAEIACEYLRKGSSALIEGRLNHETWTDKQTNQKRSKLKVIAESMQMLGSTPNQPRTKNTPTEDEDDIPY